MTENERVQFKLMVPADLKDQLESAAHANRRSLSAEMIARLQRTVDEEQFVKSTQSDAGSEDYLARLTAERIKFEGLLSQYVKIFEGYTPADIARLFKDYEDLRKSANQKAVKGNSKDEELDVDHMTPMPARPKGRKAMDDPAPSWDWENGQADAPTPISKPKGGRAKLQKR